MTYEDYLIHSSELRHFSFFKKKPKYYKKDGNRYYYSKAEWDAHLRNQQARQSNVDRTRADISSRRTKYGKPRETSDTTRLAARRERAARISKAKEDIAKQQPAYRKAQVKDIAADRQKLKSDLALNTTNKNKHLLRAEYKIKLLSNKIGKKLSEIKEVGSNVIERGKVIASRIYGEASELSEIAKDKVESGLGFMNSIWRVNIRNPKEVNEISKENRRINGTYNRRDTGIYAEEDRRVQRRAKRTRTYRGPSNWFGEKGSYSDERAIGTSAVDDSNRLLAYAKKASERERKELEKDLEKLRKKYLY